MSLRVDDRSRRSRSKSPGRGRERERSRSHAREPQQHSRADATPQQYSYDIRQPGQPASYSTPSNEPITMGNYSDLPPEQRPGYRPPPAAGPQVSYAQPGNVQYAPTNSHYTYTPSGASQPAPLRTPGASAGYPYGTTAGTTTTQYAPTPSTIKYTAKPVVSPQPAVKRTTQAASPSYTTVAPSQPQYTATPAAPPPPPAGYSDYPPPPPPMGAHSGYPEHHRAASTSAPTSTHDGRMVVEVVPSGSGGKMHAPPSPGLRPHGLSVSGGRPDSLRMDRLSVSGNRPDIQTIVPGGMPGGFPGGLPPPSPLLEAYHGTYQSISPMPHAMMLDDDLDHLPPLDSLSPRASGQSLHGHRRAHSSSRHSPSPPSRRPKDKLALEAYGLDHDHGHDHDDGYGREDRLSREDRLGREARKPPAKEKEKRRVRIYDATDDALALVDAMAAKTVDVDAIIDILPALSHDQMLELRIEYKRHCKVQGRGINIAKHIKLKTSGNFGKIAHVTALGKYESEGYWANYWYQSHSARRELLIESLMGRQNHEMREIKDAFKDKRYSDSLVKCMDKELKADKFREAVLKALRAERQEESDVWPAEYRNRDVDTLYKALRAKGGESTMLDIVVLRSDAHLRELLRTYERKYQGNFARDALRKSNNLVGEVVAHILNGVINRPARDAMLLHHALMDLIEPAQDGPRSSSGRLSAKEALNSKHERQQRFELLISRLTRLHWDRLHLIRVKSEYEEKYGRVVEEDIEEATKGDFREFCIALCQTGR